MNSELRKACSERLGCKYVPRLSAEWPNPPLRSLSTEQVYFPLSLTKSHKAVSNYSFSMQEAFTYSLALRAASSYRRH